MIAFTIPYPPLSGNHQHRAARNGGRFLDARVVAWRRLVWYAAHQADARGKFPGAVAVLYRVCAPDVKRRDLGNVEKVVSDALQTAGVIVDDNLIDDLRLIRGPVDPANPRVEVEVRTLKEVAGA